MVAENDIFMTSQISKPNKPKIVEAALDNLRFDQNTDPDKKPLFTRSAPFAGSPVRFQENMASISLEAEIITKSPQYQKLVNELREASDRFAVINFVTRDEDKSFVELILKSAFPPGGGEVFMPHGNYAAFDGSRYNTPEKADQALSSLDEAFYGTAAHYGATDFLNLEKEAADPDIGKASAMLMTRLLNAMYQKAAAPYIQANPAANKPLLIHPDPKQGIYKTLKEFSEKQETNKARYDAIVKSPDTPSYERPAYKSSVLTAEAPVTDAKTGNKINLDISQNMREYVLDLERLSKIEEGLRLRLLKMKASSYTDTTESEISRVSSEIERTRKESAGIRDELNKSWIGDKAVDLMALSNRRQGGFYSSYQAQSKLTPKSIDYVWNMLPMMSTGESNPIAKQALEKAYVENKMKVLAKLDEAKKSYVDDLNKRKAAGNMSLQVENQFKQEMAAIDTNKNEVEKQYDVLVNPAGFESFCKKMIKAEFDKYCGLLVLDAKKFIAEHSNVSFFAPAIDAFKNVIALLAKYPTPSALFEKDTVPQQTPVNNSFQSPNAAKAKGGLTVKSLQKPGTVEQKETDIENLVKLLKKVGSFLSEKKEKVMILEDVDAQGSPLVAEEKSSNVDVSGAGGERTKDDKAYVFTQSVRLKGLYESQRSSGRCGIYVTKKRIEFPGFSGNTIRVVDMDTYRTNAETTAKLFQLVQKSYLAKIDNSGGSAADMLIPTPDRRRIVNMVKDNPFNKTMALLLSSFQKTYTTSIEKQRTAENPNPQPSINGDDLTKTVRDIANASIKDEFKGALDVKFNPMKREFYWPEKHPKFDNPEWIGSSNPDEQRTTIYQVVANLVPWADKLANVRERLRQKERKLYALGIAQKKAENEDPSGEDYKKIIHETIDIRKDIVDINGQMEKIRHERGGQPPIFVLYGSASAGKSAFAGMLADLLGIDYGTLDLTMARGGLVGQTERMTYAVRRWCRKGVHGCRPGSNGAQGPERQPRTLCGQERMAHPYH